MWSASTGAPRSMSRSIDAVNGEAGAVSIVRLHSANSGRGGKPPWCQSTGEKVEPAIYAANITNCGIAEPSV